MSNLIINGGFELSSAIYCKSDWCLLSDSAAISPWTVTSPNKNFELDSTPWPNYEGRWSMDLNGDSAYTIGQNVATKPGSIYRLSFQLRANLCGQSPIYSGFVNSGGQNLGTFSYNSAVSGSSWVLTTFTLTAVATTTLVEIGSSTVGGCGPVIDDVRMVLVESNLIINGGFELSSAIYCKSDWCLLSDSGAISPWTVTSPNKNFELDSTPWPNYEGRWSMDLNGDSAYTIGQNVATKPGSIYRLSFQLRANLCGQSSIYSGFVNSGGQNLGTFSYNSAVSGSSWVLTTFTLTAVATTTLVEIGSSTVGGCGPVIDDVRMVLVGDSNLVVNGGFEDSAASFCPATNTEDNCQLYDQSAIRPWTIWSLSSNLILLKKAPGWPVYEGKYALDLKSSKAFTVAQYVPTTTGSHYNLTFYARLNLDCVVKGPFSAYIVVNNQTRLSLPIDLYTGKTTVTGFSLQRHSIWQQYSFLVKTNTPSTLLEIGSATFTTCMVVLDAVRMESVGNVNYIKNGGFEANAAAYCNSAWCTSRNQAAIAPWTVTSTNTEFELDSLAWPWPNAEGSWSMDLNGYHPYTIGQTVSSFPGARYRLSFQLNGNPCGGNIYSGFVLADKNSVGTFAYNREVSRGSWVLTSFDFTVNSTSTLVEIGSSSPGNCGPVIDDVKMFLV